MQAMGFQIPRYEKLRVAYAERKAYIIKQLEEGKTQTEIALAVGVTRARVNQIAKKLKEKAA